LKREKSKSLEGQMGAKILFWEGVFCPKNT
jgi:hypothetical protein